MQNILNFDTNILNLGRVKLRSKFNFGESSRGRQFAIEKVSVTIWWKSNKNGQQPKIKRKQILFFSAKSKIIKIRLYQNLFFEPNSTLQNLITTAVLLAPNLIQPQQLTRKISIWLEIWLLPPHPEFAAPSQMAKFATPSQFCPPRPKWPKFQNGPNSSMPVDGTKRILNFRIFSYKQLATPPPHSFLFQTPQKNKNSI